MKKLSHKEKLEYFKLVEPKLLQKYIDGGYKNLPDSVFEDLHIKGKDIIIFQERYKQSWDNVMFNKLLFEDTEFWESAYKNHAKQALSISQLDFPDDHYFYQLGVPSLKIKMLKELLQDGQRVILINKLTGDVEPQGTLENSIGLHPDMFIRLELDEPREFLNQLEIGQIDKLLSYRLKNPTHYKIPEDFPIKEAIEILNVNDFIDALMENKQWIIYNNAFGNFLSYDGFQSLKENEIHLLSLQKESGKEHGYLKKRYFFKVESPTKLRHELISNNLTVLKSISKVYNISIIIPNNNEV